MGESPGSNRLEVAMLLHAMPYKTQPGLNDTNSDPKQSPTDVNSDPQQSPTNATTKPPPDPLDSSIRSNDGNSCESMDQPETSNGAASAIMDVLPTLQLRNDWLGAALVSYPSHTIHVTQSL